MGVSILVIRGSLGVFCLQGFTIPLEIVLLVLSVLGFYFYLSPYSLMVIRTLMC